MCMKTATLILLFRLCIGTSLTRSGSSNGRSMLALMRGSSSVLEKIRLIQDPLTIPISSNVSAVNSMYMYLDTQTNVIFPSLSGVAVSGDVLKEHLMEELDYALLPKPAWDKLSKWYGLSDGSRPIIRY